MSKSNKVDGRVQSGLVALANQDLGGAHYEFFNACVKIRQKNSGNCNSNGD